MVKKTGKHKIRKKGDLFTSYERELKAMEEYLPEAEEEPKRKGKHKIKKDEEMPFFPSPEDLPEEESEEEWLERQRKNYEKEAEDFKKMAESGRKFALGTYTTVNKAVTGAKRLGRKLSRTLQQVKAKLGKHKVPTRPVQVFVEPTEEGDYVVYGQVTRKEVPLVRPTHPVKVYTEPFREEEYVKYEELM